MTPASSSSGTQVEPPEVLEDLDEIIETKKEALDQLKELSKSGGKLRDEAASLDTESRETVAPTMRTLSAEFPDITDVESLAAAHERLVEAVAAPHRNAVHQARGDVLAALEISDRVDEDEMERLEERLAEFEPETLRAATNAFDSINDRLESFPSAGRVVIAEAIVSDPEQYLSVPVDELMSVAGNVDQQVTLLTNLDAALGETSWSPTAKLADASEHYQLQETDIDSEALIDHVKTIENRVSEATAVTMAPVIRAHLDQSIPTPELESVLELLSNLSRTVATCVNQVETYEKATELVDALASPPEHDAEQIVQGVGEVDSFTQSLNDDVSEVIEGLDEDTGPVDHLTDLLTNLSTSYSAWGSRYADRLQKDGVAVQAVRSQIPEAPAFTPEQDVLPVDNEVISPDTVRTDPVVAVRTHEAYQTWAEALREWQSNGDEKATTTVGHLLTLVREGHLDAVDVSSEDYEHLCKLLGGELTLHFEDIAEDEIGD